MQMRYLAIDYGDKKVGLAVADSALAEPLQVLRYEVQDELFVKLEKIIAKNQIQKIIVGISEGKSAEKAKRFGLILKEKLNISVELVDETLSTKDAQLLSREANINRNKRRKMEDAYAAAVILQNYLDNLS